MNLSKKKKLAMRILNAGKGRIVFAESRLDEIKDAITKQDIRDLHENGAIIVKNPKGRKKIIRTGGRSIGNVRKNVNKRKKEYIILTRKFRNYLKNPSADFSPEELERVKNKIKNREFKSKAQLKEYLVGAGGRIEK